MRFTIFFISTFWALMFAQGVYALTDNFNDGDDRGWTQIQGKWDVKKGEYVQEDLKWTTTSTHETYTRSYLGEEDWSDYTFSAKVRIEKGGELAPIIGIFFRVTEISPTGDYYLFRLDARASEGPGLIKAPNSIIKINNNKPAEIKRDYILKVEVKGDSIKCYVDDKLEIDVQDKSFPQGAIGVGTFNAEGHFDDVTVNGKGIPSAVSPQGKLAQTWGCIKDR
ncbi:MAG: family 16 glycoside hydrolase [Candidatus Poribacteria bacterium]